MITISSPSISYEQALRLQSYARTIAPSLRFNHLYKNYSCCDSKVTYSCSYTVNGEDYEKINDIELNVYHEEATKKAAMEDSKTKKKSDCTPQVVKDILNLFK
jgi:hypothetical protein